MIVELKWDTEFFRKKIGKLTNVPSEDEIKKLISQSYKDRYKYLTCRIVLKKMSDIQILEKYGFYMTDIGVVWETELSSQFTVRSSQFTAREATIKDIPMLKSMLEGLFKDSRFYNDPFFIKTQADKVYQAWIENSVKDKTVKTFFVEDCGFITCKILSKNKGDIPLVGVVPKAQGKGIGNSLMSRAFKWFNEVKIKTVTVRTQINNITAMSFYNKMGFNVKYADVTMGLILNKELKKKA
ncbi:MAG: GNAT family N-acetyltransferase [Thermodesulfovibrionales bacterium]|nr:GNAT family N-acetyltransferase [Thermodesulfovibrionales bacterium]